MKKMKLFKGISALTLSAMLTLGMGINTFADNEATLTDGVFGDNTGNLVNEKLTIEKEITAYNPTAATINAPTISYAYTISAGSADKKITDNDGVVALTKAGVGEPSITSTVSWDTTETLTASSTGAANKKDITIDFSGVTFTGAGVYRYVITESLVSDYSYDNTGVTKGTKGEIRCLDVYVKDSDDGTKTGADAYDVYGYALFMNDNDINGTAGGDNTVTAAAKTTGFVADGTTDLTADSYYTYNVTVSKTLVNDNAMRSHQFPFTVTFENSDITKNIDIIGTVTGTATEADPAAGAITSLTAEPKIADGGTAVFTGIPVGTKVTVSEKNDVPGTTYKSEGVITTKETNDIDAAEKAIAPDAVSNSAVINSTAKNTIAANDKTVAFTNTFDLISPTGVIFRVAPYAALLGGAFFIVLLYLNRRKKEQTDLF